jgi:glycosyltransferase involved in cell wall biosynthesis
MSRVLLVCPEPLGHGQPAGIGIRFVEMARVLRADGHTVAVLSRDGGFVAECRTGVTTPENLLQFSSESDVAVVQGHVANDLFAHAKPIPVVVDLYDPFIVENLHYYATRGAEVFHHDHATLVNSLARGDLFLCASNAQRLFYLGLLLAVGRLNPILFQDDPRVESLIRIAPFGVQEPRGTIGPMGQMGQMGESDRAAPIRPLGPIGPMSPIVSPGPHVLFGGIYDWYDPLLAIDAVALARERVPAITLTFTHHPNPELTPQGILADTIKYARKYDFVRFEPWATYDQRGTFFERFGAALLTFPQSLETDLAMRTRIYDYLWGGLPIVTSSAPGTDELLLRYGAGLVVSEPEIGNRKSEIASFADALVQTLTDHSRHEAMRAGARTFAQEHQWTRTLEPLREFCREPRADPYKQEFSISMQVPQQPPSLLARIKRRVF